MRNIKLLIIHCSATPPSLNIGAIEIDKWHKDRGWSGIGYHYVIRRNGLVECGRPLLKSGAHAKGYNSKSIGICLVGGIDGAKKPDNNFAAAQFAALTLLLKDLISLFPKADILGHRDLPSVSKACPCFDVKLWLKDIGLKLK